jgi:hypothetical protein
LTCFAAVGVSCLSVCFSGGFAVAFLRLLLLALLLASLLALLLAAWLASGEAAGSLWSGRVEALPFFVVGFFAIAAHLRDRNISRLPSLAVPFAIREPASQEPPIACSGSRERSSRSRVVTRLLCWSSTPPPWR